MNILFLTLIDFSSLEESNIYSDLLTEFAKNNHNVYVLSPFEKRKNGKEGLLKLPNCTILKVEIGNIQKTNLLEKGISTIRIESEYIKALKYYYSNIKFDLVLYTTPPITLQKAVEFIKRRDNAKTYLLLKDIFPQNAIDLNLISKLSPIYLYFRSKEKKLYINSDFIGCMSNANKAYVLEHNPFLVPEKVEVCPNTITVKTLKKIDQFLIRAKYGIPTDKTVFIYGGNFGKPQGIDFMVESLKAILNDSEIFIVVVGSGVKRILLEKFFAEYRPNNMILLNELDKKEYETLNAACDVGMIFLDHRFTIPNFPSRLLSYLNAALPTLAVTDTATDIGRIIVENKLGCWCESNDIEGLKEKVKLLCDKNIRTEYGSNALQYLKSNYTSKHSYDIIMKHFQ